MIILKNDGGQFVNEQGAVLPLQVVKTIMAADDRAAIDAGSAGYTTASIYVNNTPRAAGRGIMAVITTAGTATWTFGGIDIVFTLVVGPTILPLAVTKTVLGTAVGSFYAVS